MSNAMTPIGASVNALLRSSPTSPGLSQAEGLEAARRLFGCYRRDDAADPDVYLAATTAVFCRYAPDVVRRAIDPRSGLPSKLKWLPTIAEIVAECEALAAADAAREKRRRDLEEQFRRREEPDRAVRPTLDELHAKHGARWGLD